MKYFLTLAALCGLLFAAPLLAAPLDPTHVTDSTATAPTSDTIAVMLEICETRIERVVAGELRHALAVCEVRQVKQLPDVGKPDLRSYVFDEAPPIDTPNSRVTSVGLRLLEHRPRHAYRVLRC